MKQEQLLREFNYCQAQLSQAKQGILHTRAGAKLGHVRAYIKLFREYTSIKKKLRSRRVPARIIGQADKVELLDKKFVFTALHKLENKEWKLPRKEK